MTTRSSGMSVTVSRSCRAWRPSRWAGPGLRARACRTATGISPCTTGVGSSPQALREVGWPGEVSEVGGWGGGVFNGGAWLEIDGRRSDVHYRDLDVIDREIAAAREGRFTIQPLRFHLAGLPSYVVLAELAVKRVLAGDLPDVSYPAALRERAPGVWWGQAEAEFGYARDYHAAGGRLAQCSGLAARAASCAAHAVLAARGQWVTNEKALFTRAGLEEIDEIFASARPEPVVLCDVVDRVRAACSAALRDARDAVAAGEAFA